MIPDRDNTGIDEQRLLPEPKRLLTIATDVVVRTSILYHGLRIRWNSRGCLGRPVQPPGTVSLVDMAEDMEARTGPDTGPPQVLAADALIAILHSIQDPVRRPVSQHDVHLWIIRHRVRGLEEGDRGRRVEAVDVPLIRERPLAELGRVRRCVHGELRAVLELEGPQPLVHVDDAGLARLLSHPELPDLGGVLQRAVARMPATSKLGIILLVERDIVVPCDDDLELRVDGLEHVHHALVFLFPADLGDVTGVQ